MFDISKKYFKFKNLFYIYGNIKQGNGLIISPVLVTKFNSFCIWSCLRKSIPETAFVHDHIKGSQDMK